MPLPYDTRPGLVTGITTGDRNRGVEMRIEINIDDCMSSGKCVADYPDAFDFDDDELATLKAGAASLTDEQMLRVARNCPSRALVLFDDEGNQIPT